MPWRQPGNNVRRDVATVGAMWNGWGNRADPGLRLATVILPDEAVDHLLHAGCGFAGRGLRDWSAIRRGRWLAHSHSPVDRRSTPSRTSAALRRVPTLSTARSLLTALRLEIGMAELRRCEGVFLRNYCRLRNVVNNLTQPNSAPCGGRAAAIRGRLTFTANRGAKQDASRPQRATPSATNLIGTKAQAGRAGTMRIASPWRTGLPPTVHTQSNRARRLAGNSSARVTLAITSSPIRTGPLKLSVCET